jgi:hypothetical protein
MHFWSSPATDAAGVKRETKMDCNRVVGCHSEAKCLECAPWDERVLEKTCRRACAYGLPSENPAARLKKSETI